MEGTVKLFKSQQNFGFIETDEMEDDVFFHVSEIDGDSIAEGTEVEFDQEDGDRGPKATDVTEK
jgi:CspA family cold shock protein